MRKIKFRGKSVEGYNIGEWVFGDLHIRSAFTHIHTDVGARCKIDPNTIGEFTGLYDCNGNKIYEGDIVEWEKDGLMYVVKFWHGMFYASVEECNDGIFGGFPLHALTEYEYKKCKIVGNIYDNPELLKGGEI